MRHIPTYLVSVLVFLMFLNIGSFSYANSLAGSYQGRFISAEDGIESACISCDDSPLPCPSRAWCGGEQCDYGELCKYDAGAWRCTNCRAGECGYGKECSNGKCVNVCMGDVCAPDEVCKQYQSGFFSFNISSDGKIVGTNSIVGTLSGSSMSVTGKFEGNSFKATGSASLGFVGTGSVIWYAAGASPSWPFNFVGSYSGGFVAPGEDKGMFTATVSQDGTVSGTATSSDGGKSTISGTLNGILMTVKGGDVTVTGQGGIIFFGTATPDAYWAAICISGDCVDCAKGLTKCEGDCANLNLDPNNCGSCGNVCSEGELCSNGVCVCESGEKCADGCKDLDSDPLNCGSCGNACGEGQTCIGGDCFIEPVCQIGTVACGKSCCGITQTCDAATSTCSPSFCQEGELQCGTACVDSDSDSLNCGVCGVSCGPDQTCFEGGCFGVMDICVGGCSTGETCMAGKCISIDYVRCSGIASGGDDDAQWSVVCSGGSCTIIDNIFDYTGNYGGSFSSEDDYGTFTFSIQPSGTATGKLSSIAYGDSFDVSGTLSGSKLHMAGVSEPITVDGTCVPSSCYTGETQCGAECVNFNTDESNCGSCGTSCLSNETCVNGKCVVEIVCADGLSQCDTKCVNLSSDSANCGSCGNLCQAGQICVNRACILEGGEEKCGDGICQADLGETSSSCPADCKEAACTDPKLTDCNGVCVDLLTSSSNCGICGKQCLISQSCFGGICCGSLNSVCKTSADCCQGTCQNGKCALVTCINDSGCNSTQWCNLNVNFCEEGCTIEPDSCKETIGDNAFCDSNSSSETFHECLVCPVPSVPDGKGSCVCLPPNFVNSTGSCVLGEAIVLPIVQLSANATAGLPPLSVNFTGSCTDPKNVTGAVSSCALQIIGAGVSVDFAGDFVYSFQNPGMYQAILAATDFSGLVSNKTILINVTTTDPVPGVSLSADPVSGSLPLSVTFAGSCNASQAGETISKCEISYGDGSSDDFIETTSYTYDELGVFTASLVSTNNYGVSNVKSLAITASEAGCVSDDDCNEGMRCYNGVCAGIVEPGPSSGGGKKSLPSITVFMEEERKAASDLLFSIFNMSKQKVLAYDTCLRGSLCTSSSDCCGAPCVGSYCACSASVCTVTADCCSGYCESGRCTSAPATSLFLLDSLGGGISSQIGCAGLIEECSPGETTCVSFCNGLTMLLLLVSFGFGAYTWRAYKHPAFGIGGGFVPLVVGLGTYPFVGIVIGIIMFALLASRSMESINDVV